jgi:hypothetical protein
MRANARHQSFHVQPRDIALFQTLFDCRVATANHLAILHFKGGKEATKKRLQKLKAAGYIGERRRLVSQPSILFLTRKGFSFLKEEGLHLEYPALSLDALEKRSRVSEVTIRHELDVMDVKAALHATISNTKQFKLEEFSTWPLLFQFTAFRCGHDGAEVLVKPDGFIRIHEVESDGGLSEHTFFLEVDRSSETQDTLVARAGCYLDYYKSGEFAIRNGGTRDQFTEYPFRVLIVLKNAERRNNTAERLLQSRPPILTQVCLSTFAEVTTDPLGPIWIRPVDYREATKGTAFHTDRQIPKWIYRRQTERESLVESRITKHRLLTS